MKRFQLQVGNGVVMRLRHPADAEAVFHLVKKNEAFLGQWLSWANDTNTPDDSLKHIEKALKDFKDGTSLELGIFLNNEFIGMVGFHTITKNYAEIGCWLSKDCNQQGIMTQCVKKLMQYAFRYRKIHRIVAKIDTENLRSNAIPKRIGCTLEGVERESQHLNGMYRSMQVWSFLKTDKFLI